jgi:hypothetical protein
MMSVLLCSSPIRAPKIEGCPDIREIDQFEAEALSRLSPDVGAAIAELRAQTERNHEQLLLLLQEWQAVKSLVKSADSPTAREARAVQAMRDRVAELRNAVAREKDEIEEIRETFRNRGFRSDGEYRKKLKEKKKEHCYQRMLMKQLELRLPS